MQCLNVHFKQHYFSELKYYYFRSRTKSSDALNTFNFPKIRGENFKLRSLTFGLKKKKSSLFYLYLQYN